jgi:hypothetical protein
MPKWLIYALGGGFGHLTRASALARAAPGGTQVRILTNSPYVATVRLAMPALDILAFDPAIGVDLARSEVLATIRSFAPDCLIVDTFPRGLGGELAEVIPTLAGRKVLLQRDVNPQYAAAYDVASFTRNYDLVIDVEETPWFIRSWEEIYSREQARTVLGIATEQPCILVCAAGNRDELEWYGAVAAQLHQALPACAVRCIAQAHPPVCPRECWQSYWPALDLYLAADVIVGGAGYNTIYESLACGIPLIARPWPRKYDRQQLRAGRASRRGSVIIVSNAAEAVTAATGMLAQPPGRQFPPRFENGAVTAVRLLTPAGSSEEQNK